MRFLSFLFPTKKPPFTTWANFIVLSNDYNPEIGEKVNLWPKPKTSTVYVYKPKTGGGDGLVGKFNNSKIHRYLNNSKLECNSKVFYRNKTVIAIKVFVEYSK